MRMSQSSTRTRWSRGRVRGRAASIDNLPTTPVRPLRGHCSHLKWGEPELCRCVPSGAAEATPCLGTQTRCWLARTLEDVGLRLAHALSPVCRNYWKALERCCRGASGKALSRSGRAPARDTADLLPISGRYAHRRVILATATIATAFC